MVEARIDDASLVLGVDVGSVAVSLACVDRQGKVACEGYALHRGDVSGTLRQLLVGLDWTRIRAVGATSRAPAVVVAQQPYDSVVAYIHAARFVYGSMNALLVVGGETFTLVRFGADGSYQESRGSSSCAAGTGSFLDQQARRLGLEGSAALSRTAFLANGSMPT
ncbi:MAG TPA: hypothetical protein PLM08_20705, partial [Polyangiaceae bacterium]|nr:hypothetical protein [Polyangiaceae bacterium]